MKFHKLIIASVSLVLALFLTACDATTVLLVNFNSDTVGSPPASTQSTGTVTLAPGAGTITVVNAPAAGFPANKWVQISHPTAGLPETGMKASFSRVDGPGKYGFLCSLYIPDRTQVVTVQFEAFNPDPSIQLAFMHLDFMPEGDVRIDDSNVRFGHFARNQSFVLSVNFNTTVTPATAGISLIGPGTSGSHDMTIDPIFGSLPRSFGAVRFWMGYQWTGTFFADDILVTRANS